VYSFILVTGFAQPYAPQQHQKKGAIVQSQKNKRIMSCVL